MGRIRSIKPELPQSETLGRCDRDARLLFILLWTICDDAGRTRAASRMLASLLFPYDDDAPPLIDGWLAQLEREGCIACYIVEGTHYIQICKWLNHQKIDHPSASKIPQFDESSRVPRESSRILAPDLDLDLDLDLGLDRNVSKSKDQEQKHVQQAARFAEFWSAYPIKRGKKAAREKWASKRLDARADELIADVENRKANDGQWQDGFAPQAAAYLHGERWEDELKGRVNGHKPPMSKNVEAFHKLQAMKNVESKPNPGPDATTDVLGLGGPASG